VLHDGYSPYRGRMKGVKETAPWCTVNPTTPWPSAHRQQLISRSAAVPSPDRSGPAGRRRLAAAHALATEAANIREAYGYEPKVSYVVALGELREALSNMGETVTLKELLASLESQLTELVGQES